MPSVYLVSDTHFGHQGITRFVNADGTKARPWDDAEVMNRDMVEYWNQTVKPSDKVYHLGDVVINRRYLSILGELNGDKVLIKGNHDLFKLKDYVPYFRDIRAYWPMNGFLLSHIPVNENQFSRWKGNIHGHTHGYHMPDPRYMNVCVEQTNYRPILFEEVLKRYKERGIE
jgi:calcineurin-like phosphoesterase family protein